MPEDGYYWCVEPSDWTIFVALLEDGNWFIPGIQNAIVLPPQHVVGRVVRPCDEHIIGTLTVTGNA